MAFKLEREVFTPALQSAVQRAKDEGAEIGDVLNAVAAAYTGLLSVFLGNPAQAVKMLRGQADHLEALIQESAENK